MNSKSGVSFGLFSGFFWGLGVAISSLIFTKFDISPFIVALIHDFFSIFVLAIILVFKNGKINFRIFLNIKSFAVVLAAILAGPVGMQCNLYAIKYIGGSLTSSVTAIYPAISVILAFFILKQKVSKNTLIGIFLIIVGIFFQSYKSEQVESFYIGLFFAFCCALAWGSESVLGSYAMKNSLSEIEALLIRQVTSFLAYMIIYIFGGNSLVNGVTSLNIILFIIIMVISNMISYIMYYMAINKLEPAKATGLNVSYVIWTALFSYILLSSSLNWQILLTSFIIILGVYVIIKE